MPEPLKIDTAREGEELQNGRLYSNKQTVSGERHSYRLISGGDRATSIPSQYGSVPTIRETEAAKAKEKPKAGYIARIQLALVSCVKAIDTAIENYEDLIGKANAVYELKDALNRLWTERENMGHQFAQVINIIQSTLFNIEPEAILNKHLKALRKVINKIAITQRLTNADLKDILKVLNQAGCDVYRFLY